MRIGSCASGFNNAASRCRLKRTNTLVLRLISRNVSAYFHRFLKVEPSQHRFNLLHERRTLFLERRAIVKVRANTSLRFARFGPRRHECGKSVDRAVCSAQGAAGGRSICQISEGLLSAVSTTNVGNTKGIFFSRVHNLFFL